jgi:heme A synthase
MSGEKNKWRQLTMRRVFRWVGIINLVVLILMALFGAYGLKTSVSVRTFFVYWSIFFILLMAAIALAMFDALATIAKFKKDHEKLRAAIRSHAQESGDLDSRAKLN